MIPVPKVKGMTLDGPVRIWKPILDVNDLAAATEFWKWMLGAEVIREVGDFGIHLGPPEGNEFCLSTPIPGV